MHDLIEGMEAVTLHVKDIHKARKFYGEVLGLKEVQFDDKTARAAYAIPGTPSLLSMHVQRPDEVGRPAGTVTGVIFAVKDPAAVCAEIKKRGGTITDEVETVKIPGRSFVRGVVADPDGNEFVIRSPPVATP